MATIENSFRPEQIDWLNTILAASTDPISVLDRTGRYLYISPAGLATFGLAAVDVLGKNWHELNCLADGMDQQEQQCAFVFQTGRAVTGEASYATVDGIKSYEYVITPILGKDGAIEAVLSTSHDITNRKQTEAAFQRLIGELEAKVLTQTQALTDLNASLQQEIARRQQVEQALNESESRFSVLTNAAFEGIIVQANGTIIDANPKFASMFGYDLEELIGKSAVDFLTPESLAVVLHHIESQYELPYEITGVKKDGTLIHLEVIGKQSWYQGRQVRVSAARDITEHKRSVITLQETQSQMQRQLAEIESIYQSAPIGLNFLDTELRFVRINQRLAEMNGRSVEEHIGRTVREVLPELADTAEQLLRPILETGEPLLNVEIIGETPAQPGVQRTWLESFLPLKDGDRIIGINTVCEEITDRKRTEQTLREQETLLRLFAQYAPVGIAMFDREMRYVMTSQRWADDYHLGSFETLIGRSHYDVFPEIPTWWRKVHQRCLAGAIDKCDEDLFVRADGTQQWLRWEVRPWHTAAGEIGGIIVFSEDISQRKRAEVAILQLNQELQQTITKMQTLLEVIPIGIGIADDPDCHHIRVNPAFAQMLNVSPTVNASLSAPVPERPATFKVYQNGRELAPEELPLQVAAKHGIEIRDLEVEVVWQDGTTITLLEYAAPLLDENGQPRGSVGAFLNITDRKQAEAALRESEERYRILVQNFPNGAVVLFDHDLRYVVADGQGLVELGLDAATLEGKTIWEAFDPETCRLLEPDYRSALAGQFLITEIPYQNRIYRSHILPLYDEQGSVRLGMSMSQNITLQKQTEQALKTARDELEQQVQLRTRELRQLADELQRSNQELEQFAYVASHDLQEPLRAVTSFTQMLAKRYQGQLDAKASTYIEFIVDGAIRMQQLIRDLLAYSRTGRYELKLQLVDCNGLLERVKQDLQVAIAETRAVIAIEPLPTIIADLNQLGNLFQNLISNSLKYRSESPPQIEISASKNFLNSEHAGFLAACSDRPTDAVAEWVFAIRDNGIGIDPQYAERIFGIFQRLHTSDEYSGTGLGLAICRKIVERHNGRIWVESHPGQGATFFFTIPITVRTQDDNSRPITENPSG